MLSILFRGLRDFRGEKRIVWAFGIIEEKNI
jgi:hypothetical protein